MLLIYLTCLHGYYFSTKFARKSDAEFAIQYFSLPVRLSGRGDLHTSSSVASLAPTVVVRFRGDFFYSADLKTGTRESPDACLSTRTGCGRSISTGSANFDVDASDTLISEIICDSESTLHRGVWI